MSDSRLEKFIYAICSMDVSDLPVPLSRIEKLWNCLITGETPDFEPLSRNEKYLMAMLDRYDISNLPAPMSRGEKLLYKIAVGETDLLDVPGYLSRYEELLKYLIENGGVGDFEYILQTLNQRLSTLYSTKERPVKSAILSGSTKYRDIDTGEILEAFEDGRNLELVSVKMPVLTTTGKNLFNPSIPFDTDYYGNEGRCLPCRYDDEKNLIITDGIGGQKNSQFQFLKFEPNTTYTFSGEIIGIQHRICIHNESEQKYVNNIGYFSLTVTTGDSGRLYVSILKVGTSDDVYGIGNFQIEKGSTSTSYEPYKSNILTVNEEVELRGLGDMQDELNCLTGEFVQRIGEIILDDGLTYTKSTVIPPGTDTNIYSRFYIENIPNYNSRRMFADKFRVDDYNYIGERLEYGTNGRAAIMILKSRLTTDDVNGLKAYLRSNPITIQYKLASESVKTVDLTTIDQDGQPTRLKTFNGITYVKLSSEGLIPEVELEVATKISETLSTLGLEHHDISETQNQLGQTIEEQSENTDATMMATTEIYEQTL